MFVDSYSAMDDKIMLAQTEEKADMLQLAGAPAVRTLDQFHLSSPHPRLQPAPLFLAWQSLFFPVAPSPDYFVVGAEAPANGAPQGH